MRIAAAQMDIAWHDRTANHTKARLLAEEADKAGADLFILPEMFATGFSMDTSVTPEPLEGPTPELLRLLAQEHSMAVIGGFVLKRGADGPENVALAVDHNGNDLGLYAKIHQIALLDEDAHYEPGTLPVVFDLAGTGVTCFICYDLRFPELFRLVVDQCKLIVVIASWPTARQGHWDVFLRSRAIECQCFIAGVNRVGEGGGLTFTGGSAVVDPVGEILAHAGDNETLLVVDLDLAKVAETRAAMPFLKDRKPHLFKKLSE
jgi:predicted amidohydrolase